MTAKYTQVSGLDKGVYCVFFFVVTARYFAREKIMTEKQATV